MRGARGFTVLEAVVAVAVVAILLAFIVPTLAGLVQTDQVTATQQQAERIHRAIFGDPVKGDFGYLGDMGRLPANLTELVDRGSQTAFHTDDSGTPHAGNVGTGWRGPYLKSLFSTSDLLKDAWGQPFQYTDTGPTAGQIVSKGPDGILGTSDDIKFPIHPPATTGRLLISVLANRIPDALGATAKLYSPANGEQTVTTTQKNLPADPTFDGFFFDAVKHGLHVLVVAHTGQEGDTGPCVTVSRTVTVGVVGGQSVVKEVRMLTTADVKVTDNPCTIPD